jgi:predicted PurR-regulated permease PerM
MRDANAPKGRVDRMAHSKCRVSHQLMSSSPDYRLYAAWSAIAAVLACVLWWLLPVLTPFLIAAVMAYVLSPVVQRLQTWLGKGFPKSLLVLVCEIAFIAILLAVVALVVPVLFKEAARIQTQLPQLLDELKVHVEPVLLSYGFPIELDAQALKVWLAKNADGLSDSAVSSVLASLRIGGSVALAVVGNLVLIPVVLFYLLMDGHVALSHLRKWVPLQAKASVDSFVNEADSVLGEYLRGQLLVMLILAVYYVIGLSLFGLSVAWPIGIFTGLAMFVPYVGFGVGLLLAALSGFLEMAPMQATLMLVVVFGLGQLLESFVLTPRLVGERIGLHPLTVIFALLAFGQMLGFVGVLMALPASAVLLVAMRRLRERYMASRLYGG